MSLVKLNALKTPTVLKTADFETFEFARLAHLNSLMDQINAANGAVKTAGAVTLTPVATGATVAQTITTVNANLVLIETKLNLIIAALS
jgi:hypothetical protein